MAETPIGRVVHYFDKALVAVVALSGTLKPGDRIRLEKGERVFEMDITSMEVDRKPVPGGKKGDEVAIKLTEPTKEGARVFKV